MKGWYVFVLMHFWCSAAKSQELFLFTNPASNVPKNTLVARGMNSFFQRSLDKSISFHYMPEIEFGLTKKIMVIANGVPVQQSLRNHKLGKNIRKLI